MKSSRAIALHARQFTTCRRCEWLSRTQCSFPKLQNALPWSYTGALTVSKRVRDSSNASGTRRHVSTTTTLSNPMDEHKRAVEVVSATVRGFYDRKEKFRIYHGSTNSTRGAPRKPGNTVDTSKLSHVLSVDKERKTALVEPNVPMDRLIEETLKHGLIPPVVMEFPGITVGGGYAGTSGESSSFRHGFFNRTLNYVQMVLANGDVVKMSEQEMPDLFHGAAGAVGTMGVTTMVEIQLQEAKKYVETTYHPVSNMSEAIKKLQEATEDPSLDYVDGIMFSLSQGAVITGQLTDQPKTGLRVRRFSAAKDPWFYLHVQETITEHPQPTTEAIPLPEYLFRYDRGGFWVGASAFDYFKIVPFNRFTRWFLDDFLHTRMMYTALAASGQAKKYIVQDLALPYDTAEAFVNYTDKTFGIYPLWLCPLKQSPLPTMHPYNTTQVSADGSLKPLLNIGLWGFGPKNHDAFVAANRDLERKLKELGGMKWLYAQTYYTEDEFWEMYDKEWYDGLRKKYDATSLPSVYEKVKVDVEAEKKARSTSWIGAFLKLWPIAGFYGIRKAVQSGSYIDARKSAWKSIHKRPS